MALLLIFEILGAFVNILTGWQVSSSELWEFAALNLNAII